MKPCASPARLGKRRPAPCSLHPCSSPAASPTSLIRSMVLTDLIGRRYRHLLARTGRLRPDLIRWAMNLLTCHLRYYYPRHEAAEAYTRTRASTVSTIRSNCAEPAAESARSSRCAAPSPDARPGSCGLRSAQSADSQRTAGTGIRRDARPGEIQPARRLVRTRSLGLHPPARRTLTLRDLLPSIGCPCARHLSGEDTPRQQLVMKTPAQGVRPSLDAANRRRFGDWQ